MSFWLRAILVVSVTWSGREFEYGEVVCGLGAFFPPCMRHDSVAFIRHRHELVLVDHIQHHLERSTCVSNEFVQRLRLRL
jgi:hypothetical protein